MRRPSPVLSAIAKQATQVANVTEAYDCTVFLNRALWGLLTSPLAKYAFGISRQPNYSSHASVFHSEKLGLFMLHDQG